MRKKTIIFLSILAFVLAIFVCLAVATAPPTLRVGTTLENPTLYFQAKSADFGKENNKFFRHSVIGRDQYFVCRTEYWLRTNHVILWRLCTYRLDGNDTITSASVNWKWQGDF